MPITIIRGNIARCNEMPADLMATSSYFSPRSPKVMIDASKTAKGKARVTLYRLA